ncbi:MAG: alpha/beta hydrolase [Deltaproteobacteria bacterium]|nr:alpha/beta hydrolase [Deltaproteobacteria bacterium]
MPYLTTSDSTLLYYEESGKGKPLLFVHGWSLSSQIWTQQKDYFSSRYRCVAVDLRGHGRSNPSASGYGVEVLASDVSCFLDSLGLSDVTLFGWSLGSLVALAAYPLVRDRLAAMVLVSPTSKYCSSAEYPYGLPEKEPRSLSLLLKRNPEKALDNFLRKMFTGQQESDRGFDDFEKDLLPLMPIPLAEVLVQVLQTLQTADLRPVLSSIREPALLLHGDRDLICPAAASQYLEEQIATATRIVLAGAGHAPMFSRPAEFNAAIESFLKNIYG